MMVVRLAAARACRYLAATMLLLLLSPSYAQELSCPGDYATYLHVGPAANVPESTTYVMTNNLGDPAGTVQFLNGQNRGTYPGAQNPSFYPSMYTSSSPSTGGWADCSVQVTFNNSPAEDFLVSYAFVASGTWDGAIDDPSLDKFRILYSNWNDQTDVYSVLQNVVYTNAPDRQAYPSIAPSADTVIGSQCTSPPHTGRHYDNMDGTGTVGHVVYVRSSTPTSIVNSNTASITFGANVNQATTPGTEDEFFGVAEFLVCGPIVQAAGDDDDDDDTDVGGGGGNDNGDGGGSDGQADNNNKDSNLTAILLASAGVIIGLGAVAAVVVARDKATAAAGGKDVSGDGSGGKKLRASVAAPDGRKASKAGTIVKGGALAAAGKRKSSSSGSSAGKRKSSSGGSTGKRKSSSGGSSAGKRKSSSGGSAGKRRSSASSGGRRKSSKAGSSGKRRSSGERHVRQSGSATAAALLAGRLSHADALTGLRRLLLRDDAMLLTAIVDNAGTSLEFENLADALVAVFVADASSLSRLMSWTVRRARDADKDASTGSSFTGRMLRSFMQRVCSDWIVSTLSAPVSAIVAVSTALEIDPAVEPDASRRSRNVEEVRRLTTGIVDALSAAAPVLPPAASELARLLTQEVDERGQRLVADALFVRLVCPALISPHKYGLSAARLTPVQQGNALVVSKLLQVLVTTAVNSGALVKEQHMAVFREYVARHTKTMRSFFSAITASSSGKTMRRLSTASLGIVSARGVGDKEVDDALRHFYAVADEAAPGIMQSIDAGTSSGNRPSSRGAETIGELSVLLDAMGVIPERHKRMVSRAISVKSSGSAAKNRHSLASALTFDAPSS